MSEEARKLHVAGSADELTDLVELRLGDAVGGGMRRPYEQGRGTASGVDAGKGFRPLYPGNFFPLLPAFNAIKQHYFWLVFVQALLEVGNTPLKTVVLVQSAISDVG